MERKCSKTSCIRRLFSLGCSPNYAKGRPNVFWPFRPISRISHPTMKSLNVLAEGQRVLASVYKRTQKGLLEGARRRVFKRRPTAKRTSQTAPITKRVCRPNVTRMRLYSRILDDLKVPTSLSLPDTSARIELATLPDRSKSITHRGNRTRPLPRDIVLDPNSPTYPLRPILNAEKSDPLLYLRRKTQGLPVSARALRTMDRKGGLDEYLCRMPDQKLGLVGRAMRADVIKGRAILALQQHYKETAGQDVCVFHDVHNLLPRNSSSRSDQPCRHHEERGNLSLDSGCL